MTSTSHDLRKALTGISGILVTPFDGADEISPIPLVPIVERAINSGVHILVSNGNTGEFYGLTTEEAEQMVRATSEILQGRVPLVAGIGKSVKDACKLAHTSAQAGADILMIHQPPDPFVAPSGVVEYIKRVSDAGDGLPLVIYLRNDLIGTEGIKALCDIDGVIGVKWATPNPQKLAAAMAACDPSIIWVGGLAEIWAPAFYAVGARGFTSGLINVWPEHSVAIHAALDAGDYDQARALIARMRAFENVRAQEMNGTNVTGVKAALQLMGNDCGAARPPSAWPLTGPQHDELKTMLLAEKLLKA
jgi:4-hydroxy-tetrahydrodipicolinate synthase